MKNLSDYQGDEAIELWADLLDSMSEIFSDARVSNTMNDKSKSKLDVVKTILKYHNKAATQMLLRIDPTPINGLNVITRFMGLLSEIVSDPEAGAFFGFAGQVKMDGEFSGSPTEITEGGEN